MTHPAQSRVCPHCGAFSDTPICHTDGYRTVAAGFRAAPDPLIGAIFEERYRIEELIGRGGMGRVYRARQLAVQRDVAIKILRRDMVDELKEVMRFQLEARALAALDHPGITSVHDFGQTRSGDLFLVLEYLRGQELGERLKEGRPMAPEEVARIACEVLDALADAHHKGVVHRDLKPQNIYLTEVGRKSGVVRLLDFGIAKMFEDPHAPDEGALTLTGVTIGSPRYMSPEQAMGYPITPQTDLYSLGATMWEMLCGRPLFEETSPTGYMLAHVNRPATKPTRDGQALAGPLVDIIMEMLSKDPAARPRSAEAVLIRLRAVQSPLVRRELGPAAEPSSIPPPTAPGARGGGHASAPSSAAPARVSAPAIEDNVMTTAVSSLTGAELPRPDAHTGARRVWIAAFVLVLGGFLFLLADTLNEPATPASGVRDDTAAAGQVALGQSRRSGSPVAAGSKPSSPVDEAKLAGDEFSVELMSTPSGAAVIRKGQRLGQTPFRLIWKKTHKPPTVRLVAEGYVSRKVKVLLTDAGGVLEVELDEKSGARSEGKRSRK